MSAVRRTVCLYITYVFIWYMVLLVFLSLKTICGNSCDLDEERLANVKAMWVCGESFMPDIQRYD